MLFAVASVYDLPYLFSVYLRLQKYILPESTSSPTNSFGDDERLDRVEVRVEIRDLDEESVVDGMDGVEESVVDVIDTVVAGDTVVVGTAIYLY